MKVAITGSIACGKSLITNYLLTKNYEVIDADKIGHQILENNDVKKQILSEFGKEILTDHTIDRKKLGGIVFKDKSKLDKLNSITHPKIKEIIINKFSESKNIIFLDMALLYEINFNNIVDKVIVVHVEKETQLTRLMKRNDFSKEEALRRINSQMSSKEKSKLADFVIDNNGSKENSYLQMDRILEILKG